ncbi:MAG: hypothetical protein IJC83_02805 [Oscillospiraceae bacterium]|nr:hypothetical protein [Oscillospiraceae bacterium]
MKKLIIPLFLCAIMLSINVSASSIYSDNFMENGGVVSYSGMQAGYTIAGSSEVCAKALSSFASATYKLNDISSISASFYTPIYSTAIAGGENAVLGYNSFANVFLDGAGNVVTRVGDVWKALAFNTNTFAYEFSSPIDIVNESMLIPFLFSVEASSDGISYSKINYSISCSDATVANRDAVKTQISASLPQGTEYVKITTIAPPANLVSGYYCYLSSVTIAYTEEVEPISSSEADDNASSSEISSSSVAEISSSSEVSSSSENSSSENSSSENSSSENSSSSEEVSSSSNNTTKREDIDKDISSSIEEEDEQKQSSSSLSDKNSKPESSSENEEKSSSSKTQKEENSKVVSSSKTSSTSKPKSSSTVKSSSVSDDVIEEEEQDKDEEITNSNIDEEDDEESNVEISLNTEFPIGAIIYMVAIVVAGAVIFIIKLKK